MRMSTKLALLAVLTPLLAGILSVYVTLRMIERGGRETHQVTCELAARVLAAYRESPPTTPAGLSVVEAWREEYRVLRCTEPAE